MKDHCIYIYAIVPNSYGADFFKPIEKSGTYAIPYQGLSAIVSDRDSSLIDYSDRESLGYLLVHHQKTIEELMSRGITALIPVRLGTIVKSPAEVIRILSNGYVLLTETMAKTENLTEIDIAVTWADFPSIIQEVACDPEIVALRDDLREIVDNHLKINQVKAGMLVQTKLKEKNSRTELSILESLSSVSVDIKTHETMNDAMVTNSAFLINRSNSAKFESIIDRIDEEYSGKLNFKIVGPLPCYSFFTIECSELAAEEVETAMELMGLKGEASEPVLKRAYLEKAKLFHPDSLPHNGSAEEFSRITKAYHILVDYTRAGKQISPDGLESLRKGKHSENLILVKIKE